MLAAERAEILDSNSWKLRAFEKPATGTDAIRMAGERRPRGISQRFKSGVVLPMSSNDNNFRFPLGEDSGLRESMENIAIHVSNLSKCYHIYDAPRDRLKQFVAPRLQRLAGRSAKQYFREFWALRNVSIEVRGRDRRHCPAQRRRE
jgi:hypothetical protein